MTVPPDPTTEDTPWGRYLRAVLGSLLLVGNLVLLYLDARNHEPMTTQDLGLHGGLLVAALLLIDPSALLELAQIAKGFLPGAK